MSRVRPLEVKAILPLLREDWPDEIVVDRQGREKFVPGDERLAEACILALDKARASRTSYVGVMAMGKALFGVGPYPGAKTAQKVLMKYPIGDKRLITGHGVAAILSPEAVEEKFRELDK